jgi:hypothetical protein
LKLATKAALFSAFVLPGAGYFVLHKTGRGILALLITLGTLVVMMQEASYKAKIIGEKIVQGSIPINVESIQHEILTLPGKYNADTLALLSWTLLAVWLISIADGYRTGWKMDQQKMKSDAEALRLNR